MNKGQKQWKAAQSWEGGGRGGQVKTIRDLPRVTRGSPYVLKHRVTLHLRKPLFKVTINIVGQRPERVCARVLFKCQEYYLMILLISCSWVDIH